MNKSRTRSNISSRSRYRSRIRNRISRSSRNRFGAGTGAEKRAGTGTGKAPVTRPVRQARSNAGARINYRVRFISSRNRSRNRRRSRKRSRSRNSNSNRIRSRKKSKSRVPGRTGKVSKTIKIRELVRGAGNWEHGSRTLQCLLLVVGS